MSGFDTSKKGVLRDFVVQCNGTRWCCEKGAWNVSSFATDRGDLLFSGPCNKSREACGPLMTQQFQS